MTLVTLFFPSLKIIDRSKKEAETGEAGTQAGQRKARRGRRGVSGLAAAIRDAGKEAMDSPRPRRVAERNRKAGPRRRSGSFAGDSRRNPRRSGSGGRGKVDATEAADAFQAPRLVIGVPWRAKEKWYRRGQRATSGGRAVGRRSA
ncbi:hypothetical protein NL676_034191 [Syzygium grande]|nr:hypothetical protein NL676_034191 [Syzygium grande]